MVEIQRIGHRCSLFSIAVQIPKLDVAGSTPVSRSIKSSSRRALTCCQAAEAKSCLESGESPKGVFLKPKNDSHSSGRSFHSRRRQSGGRCLLACRHGRFPCASDRADRSVLRCACQPDAAVLQRSACATGTSNRGAPDDPRDERTSGACRWSAAVDGSGRCHAANAKEA